MTREAARVAIVPLAWRDVVGRLSEIAEIWPAPSRDRVGEILPRHAERPGFRFFAALDDADALAGFVYGYLGGPGQWWHDLVSARMTPEQRAHWIAPGHFELVELHVRRNRRRHGIGSALHDTVLTGLDSRTAVLSTQVDNEPALGLYAGRGWRVVVPEMRFSPGGIAYSILGLELAGRSGE